MFPISGLEHTKHLCKELKIVKPQHSTVSGAKKLNHVKCGVALLQGHWNVGGQPA